MLSIDRDASLSVREQLTEQLRYQIAGGQYQTGQTLPSTRALADRLDVSFHTVRKAYQALQAEGLLEVQPGRGYTVKERAPLAKSERMERGALVVREAIQRLVGLGLSDEEAEALFLEQRGVLEHATQALKLLFAASYRELAEQGARRLGERLGKPVEPVLLQQLDRHQDADYVFTPHPHLRTTMQELPRADVLGMVMHLHLAALERIARLRPLDTLGLVTRHPDAIAPLTKELRLCTGFSGQVLAASINEGTEHLSALLEQVDLLAYTPGSQHTPGDQPGQRASSEADGPPRVELTFVLSPASVEAVQDALPS